MSSAAPETQVRADEKPKRASSFQSLVRLRPYAGSALTRITLGMVVALIGTIIAMVIPQVIRAVVDGPLAHHDVSGMWWAGIAVLALGLGEALMIFLRRQLVLTPSTRVEATLRVALYRKLQDLQVSFHDRWQSGQLLSRAVSDISLIRRWLAFGLVLLTVNFITVIVGFVFLTTISWVLGLVFLVCSIPLWFVCFGFERRYRVVSRRSQDQSGDLATRVEESVHGIRVLKAFGRGSHALRQFVVEANELRETEIAKAKAISRIWMFLIMVPDLTFAICLFVGVWLAATGSITVGGLVAFFATAAVLRWPVESIGFLLSMTVDCRTAADRFFEVMDTPVEIVDPEHPKTVEDPRGELVFDDVHFRYEDAPETQPDLLDGIDLTIEPGETMALVGLTGSGKSTLLMLASRMYDVTGGAVKIDGVDVRDLTRNEVHTHMAMAFEDATLFSSSVRENVLLGRPDASDAELDEALRIAQAQFVYDLPEGLDTRIGEEGLSLSGGQRQRLALARAIAAKPSVLVLDDPLSALDVETEALVEEALRNVLASTTALIVAHRPSTVSLADRVAVLENGRITAVGLHSELLATSEHYRFVISSLDEESKAQAQFSDRREEPMRSAVTQGIELIRSEERPRGQDPLDEEGGAR